MDQLGWLLYLVLALLLFYFWRQIRGASFDDLLDRAADEHHHVAAVLRKHPRGGDWRQFSHWMRGKH